MVAYICGQNIPGYLPDAEPIDLDTWESAVQWLCDSIEMYAEESEDFGLPAIDSEANKACAALRAIESPQDVSVNVGNYAFWIQVQP